MNLHRHVGDLRSELRQAYAELANVELRDRPDRCAQPRCGAALRPREPLAERAIHHQSAALQSDPGHPALPEQSREGEVEASIVHHEPRGALPWSDLQLVHQHMLRPSALVALCPDLAQIEGEARDDARHVLGCGHLEMPLVRRQAPDRPCRPSASCVGDAREVGYVLADRYDGRKQPDLVDAPLAETREPKSGPERRDRVVGVVVRERHANVLQGQAVRLLRPFRVQAELVQVRRERERDAGRGG